MVQNLGEAYRSNHSDNGQNMSVAPVSSSIPAYQVPQTPAAKTTDEQTESITVEAKEAKTGKESTAPVKLSAVDITA